MRSRKNTPNLRLKAAIVATGKKQGGIAKSLGIGEVRMSAIVCGRLPATADERQAIAGAVNKPEAEIFEDGPETGTPPTDGRATNQREGERRSA